VILLSEGLYGAHQDVVAIQKMEMATARQGPQLTAEHIARDLIDRRRKSPERPNAWSRLGRS